MSDQIARQAGIGPQGSTTTASTEVQTMSDSIEVLAAKVAEAQDRLCSAHEDTEAARREETARLNAYNEACKEFDKAIEAIREDAPRNTDWAAKRRNHE